MLVGGSDENRQNIGVWLGRAKQHNGSSGVAGNRLLDAEEQNAVLNERLAVEPDAGGRWLLIGSRIGNNALQKQERSAEEKNVSVHRMSVERGLTRTG